MEHQEILSHPSIGHSYKYGWQQMKKYFVPLLLVMLVLIIAELPAGLADFELNDDMELEPANSLYLIGVLYSLLILPVIQYGVHFTFLKSARNQGVEISEVFSGFGQYLNIILANLLMMLLVGLGLLVFILPGIYILCRLAFVPYIVMDQRLGPVAAVQKSWQLTRDHFGTILVFGLLAIPIAIAGILLLFVGIIFAAMWVFCSFAGLYYAISSNQQADDLPGNAGDPQITS